MRRPLYIWIIFLACLGVVVAAMGWVSLTALQLDRAESLARRDAAMENRLRLALWRMDSSVAALLARESTRPFFLYRSFYPANRPYPYMFQDFKDDDELLASPLLLRPHAKIQLYFQFEPDGTLTSPQVPPDDLKDKAIEAGATDELLAVAALRRNTLGINLDREKLLAALNAKSPTPRKLVEQHIAEHSTTNIAPGNMQNTEELRNVIEYAKRKEISQRMGANEFFLNNDGVAILELPVGQAGMKAVWVDGMLILARRMLINGKEYVQGGWLNWPEVKTALLDQVRDLFPMAEIEPITETAVGPDVHQLTGLPVRLKTNLESMAVPPANSAIRVSLIMAWICVTLAAVAFAALLIGVVSLSERRGAFVSAVTHELRTPITSLRMYTEMLAEGMINNDEKRLDYMKTMNAEADRLGHLVENVLTYSRLERGRARSRIESLTLPDLIDRVKHRLVKRAEQAGFKVIVEAPDEKLNERKVIVDTTAVEQILFNLVDNACKYSANGRSSSGVYKIHLEPGMNGNLAAIRVRDHGQGISEEDAERLFRPFTKSVYDAAHSAPGVGLGLALSRRLARLMGGELDLDKSVAEGACFVLTLPSR